MRHGRGSQFKVSQHESQGHSGMDEPWLRKRLLWPSAGYGNQRHGLDLPINLHLLQIFCSSEYRLGEKTQYISCSLSQSDCSCSLCNRLMKHLLIHPTLALHLLFTPSPSSSYTSGWQMWATLESTQTPSARLPGADALIGCVWVSVCVFLLHKLVVVL